MRAAGFSRWAGFGVLGGALICLAGLAALRGGKSVLKPKGWDYLSPEERDRLEGVAARVAGVTLLVLGAGAAIFFMWAWATGLDPF